MLISSEKAVWVYKKVAAVQEHIRTHTVAGNRIRLHVEDLQKCICDMYGLTIEKKEVSFAGDFVRGMVERYADNRAIIYIRADQSADWKRFVATKELCHVLIDQPEDWSAVGTQTIEALVYEASIQSHQLAPMAAQSEMMALVAAVELVYPYSDRVADRQRRQAMPAISISRIALQHGVPQWAIGLGLNPEFMTFAEATWQEVSPHKSNGVDHATAPPSRD